MNVDAYLQVIFSEMLERKASDMHIRAGSPPMLRVMGNLEASRTGESLSPEQTKALAHAMMNEKQRHHFDQRLEVDFSYTVANLGRFRGNAFQQRGVVNVALRVVPSV